jgi:SAM-dependent methyltransferase
MNNRYNLNLWSKRSTHNILVSMVGKNKKVLDVGCARWYLWSSSDDSNHFWWLDYNGSDIVEAKKVYEDAIQYDLNDIKDLPWDEKFDIIIYADILEHVLHPEKVLQFFDKYLTPWWKVILSVPNVANRQVRFGLLFGNFDYVDGAGIMDDTHLKIYTYKTATQLMNKWWYNVTKRRAWASVFWPIINIFPFLKGLLATNIILECEKK